MQVSPWVRAFTDPFDHFFHLGIVSLVMVEHTPNLVGDSTVTTKMPVLTHFFKSRKSGRVIFLWLYVTQLSYFRSLNRTEPYLVGNS